MFSSTNQLPPKPTIFSLNVHLVHVYPFINVAYLLSLDWICLYYGLNAYFVQPNIGTLLALILPTLTSLYKKWVASVPPQDGILPGITSSFIGGDRVKPLQFLSVFT